MTEAVQILNLLRDKPGLCAREIAKAIFGSDKARSGARGKTNGHLLTMTQLDIVLRLKVEPRTANDSPHYRYYLAEGMCSVLGVFEGKQGAA